MNQAVYRILDAAANRASEGIRTVEEWLRFGLDDAEGAAGAKELRHRLAAALSRLSRDDLLRARNTGGDVGTQIGTDSEYERPHVADVLTAAAQRVQQSLRVLEEYGKTIDVDFARQIESVRYRSYSVFRRAEMMARGARPDGIEPDDSAPGAHRPEGREHSRTERTRGTRQRLLADARLYALVDRATSDDEFAQRMRTWADAGVDVFQLRDKTATDRTLFQRGLVGARVARETGTLFVVNDRADLAVAAKADGVHVGQEELPVPEARSVLGPERLIGLSTHDPDQVRTAIAAGADYLGCGPTFPSTTKAFAAHAGTAFLKTVSRTMREEASGALPSFAIGGIAADNLNEVIDSGFYRIAVTAAISDAADPVAAIVELKKRLLAAGPVNA